MLATVPPSILSVFGNADAPSTVPVTDSTSGAAHTKGSWVQLGSDLTEEIIGFWIHTMASVAPSGADSRALMDIGVDPAGGSSYTEIVANLNMAGVGNSWGRVPRQLWIPLRVPSGAAIGVRHQATLASDVLRHTIWCVAAEVHPWQGWSAAVCDTYGADTAASEGTAITTGNQGASGAEGTWVNIGTASKDYRAVHLTCGIDGADTAWAQRGYVLDIGIDPAGGSSYSAIANNINWNAATTEEGYGPLPIYPAIESIPQGSTMAVRVSSSGSAVEPLSVLLHCYA